MDSRALLAVVVVACVAVVATAVVPFAEAEGDDKQPWPADDPLEDGVCEKESFDACGGDLVGSWHLADMCMSRSPIRLPEDCEGAKSDIQLALSGKAEFREDGTFTMKSGLYRRTRVDMPCKCIPKKVRKEKIESGDVEKKKGRCIDTDYLSNEDDAEEGFYKVEGSTVYLADSKEELKQTDQPYGGPRDFEFCVDGNEAWLKKAGGRVPGGHKPDQRMLMKKAESTSSEGESSDTESSETE